MIDQLRDWLGQVCGRNASTRRPETLLWRWSQTSTSEPYNRISILEMSIDDVMERPVGSIISD